MGRATQGVILINLDDGTKLSGMQRIVENDAQAGADDTNEDGANEDGASDDAAPDEAA
jgi:DNA gyrase subunit A